MGVVGWSSNVGVHGSIDASHATKCRGGGLSGGKGGEKVDGQLGGMAMKKAKRELAWMAHSVGPMKESSAKRRSLNTFMVVRGGWLAHGLFCARRVSVGWNSLRQRCWSVGGHARHFDVCTRLERERARCMGVNSPEQELCWAAFATTCSRDAGRSSRSTDLDACIATRRGNMHTANRRSDPG